VLCDRGADGAPGWIDLQINQFRARIAKADERRRNRGE
jgi:hypothetical protein